MSKPRGSSTAPVQARRYHYRSNDMADRREARRSRRRRRTASMETPTAWSMDGILADLESICDLADKYRALDGRRLARGRLRGVGRGTPDWRRRTNRYHHRTLGKALGGASGGYTAGRKGNRRVVRQRSRPTSPPTVSPCIAAAPVFSTCCKATGRALRGRVAATAAFSADDRTWLQPRSGRARDHPGDAGRRGARDAHG